MRYSHAAPVALASLLAVSACSDDSGGGGDDVSDAAMTPDTNSATDSGDTADTGSNNDTGSTADTADASSEDSGHCVPTTDMVCFDGDVYRQDSCSGERTLVLECDYGCEDATCSACQPDCSSRSCGEDPVCGESCGECSGLDACTDTGQCEPSATWATFSVDGTEHYSTPSFEAFYMAGQDTGSVFLPHYGRNVQISLRDISANSSASQSCAQSYGGGASITVTTTDNGWTGIDALPDEWEGLTWSVASCNGTSAGDQASVWRVDATTVTPDRMVGDFEIVVDGAGPRAGQTLRIAGEFDVAPEQP